MSKHVFEIFKASDHLFVGTRMQNIFKRIINIIINTL